MFFRSVSINARPKDNTVVDDELIVGVGTFHCDDDKGNQKDPRKHGGGEKPKGIGCDSGIQP